MTDVLDMAHINSLPQPFFVRLGGGKDWWPVYDIGVDVPILRIDVVGKLEPRAFAEVVEIRDADGAIHDPDAWYIDEADQ